MKSRRRRNSPPRKKPHSSNPNTTINFLASRINQIRPRANPTAIALTSLSLSSWIGSVTGASPGTTIYQVVYRPTHELYALRVILMDKPETVRRLIYNHAMSMCKIQAPNNNVNYFDAFYAAADEEACIMMEYVAGESLQGKQISYEKELSFVAEQILCGLHDMHTQKRVHRNLSPANILIGHRTDSCRGKVSRIRVAEFGSSLGMWNGDLYSDMAYMSPESINTSFSYSNYDGYGGDVWSFRPFCSRNSYSAGRNNYDIQ